MVLLCAVIAAACGGAPELFSEAPVFIAGEGGYDTYRIPGVVVAKDGTILLFAEGRRNSSSDSGDIDMVLRRSTDGGKTWGPMQVILDDGVNACSNPCPIVERETGDVILLFTKTLDGAKEHEILRGTKPACTVWRIQSADSGATWSAPREITATASKPEWRWYAVGPGHGIQLKSGRIVVPCNHALDVGPDTWHSHVILSDDKGASWRIGGIHENKTNESAIVELSDSSLYQNMRNYRGTHVRAFAVSKDKGETWAPIEEDHALIEPVCEASLVQMDDGKATTILFANPASRKRENLTLRASYDNAKTWKHSKIVYAGPAAYSDLGILPDQTIVCAYERGAKSAYESIVVALLKSDWLTTE
jgi:sialidase-1